MYEICEMKGMVYSVL